MEELKDIKGLVEVPDDSLIYLIMTIGGIVLALVLIVVLIRWQQRPKRRRQHLSPQERAKAVLNAIDFKDTKESVYAFSEASQILNPNHEGLKGLLKRLERYKYQPQVPPLDAQDKTTMQTMIKELTHAK